MRQDRLAALSSKETKSVPPKEATALEEVAVTFTAPAPTSFPKQLVLPTGFRGRDASPGSKAHGAGGFSEERETATDIHARDARGGASGYTGRVEDVLVGRMEGGGREVVKGNEGCHMRTADGCGKSEERGYEDPASCASTTGECPGEANGRRTGSGAQVAGAGGGGGELQGFCEGEH